VPELEQRRLDKGIHKGFEWEIVRNDYGFRCGYVRVLPGHPWFEKTWNDEWDVKVHGGVTFNKYGTACPTHGEKAEWWIGFDCAHYLMDLPDPSLPNALPRLNDGYEDLRHKEASIKTTAYVRDQCIRLADQAYAAALELEDKQ
jgi:hypothetical protein